MSLFPKYEEKELELRKTYPKLGDPEYKGKRELFLRAQARLETDFMTELLVELDVLNNPKAKLAYSIAFEDGHSEGFSGIESNFRKLVTLIK